MIKTILVPLLGDKLDESVLGFAYAAAAQFRSHIHVLHVGRNPVDDVLRLTTGDGFITREVWNEVERGIRRRRESARECFDRFCKARAIQVCDAPKAMSTPSASWQQIEGNLATEIGMQARFHDLTVVGRADDTSGFTPRELGDILVRSGRPMLIVSDTKAAPKAFETVAVGWKDTLEAAHMMTAAMPLLEAAKRVVVLIASEHSDASAYGQYAKRLTAELKWHGIEPEIRHLAPGAVPVAEALVDAANKAGADLLVLGGYGHSRAKELVFGGVTRYMLETANFPALIVH